MSDTLSETEACDLLSRLFRARGYRIVRNVLFREYGVEFHADGWDAKARVGFEFLSSEDEDHVDLSLEEYQTLADAQRRGELALFIIDEVEPLSAAELAAEAGEFLDEAAAVVRARRSRTRTSGAKGKLTAASRKPRGSAKAATKKAAVKKAAVKKAMTVAGTVAGKKAAARKPSGTKSGRVVKKASGKPSAVKAARGKGRSRTRR